MRLYGKRFMANRTEGRISNRKESRDAVVYDISEANRYCRVMVAGSSTLVHAWFPANFMRAPRWLKVGIAVRVGHVGGDKSRIEVVSPGLVQPIQATMPMSGGANTVLLGMLLTAPIEGAGSWNVTISGGTYRINGVSYIYSPDGTLMGEDVLLGSGIVLGSAISSHGVDPMTHDDPAELWFRYDAFAIGNDGVVDYLKGDEWEFVHSLSGFPAGSPDKPAIASDHVQIGSYILLWTGTTSISRANIGKEYESPRPDHLDVTVGYHDPIYETGDDWARAQEGVGIIRGGGSTYAPFSPGGLQRGSAHSDMQTTVTVRVMTQYNTPHSWWSDGSQNYLSFRKLGSASYDGYGTAGSIPDLTDESGQGPEYVVWLGLGNSASFNYERKNSYVSQPDPGSPGYPGYYQGDSDSHTAIFSATLVSPDVISPVMSVISVYNLDAAGRPQ